jgi:4-hydroxyproline epimerase
MSVIDFQRIRVIDTHTGGEPTRVVIEGGPDLGSGSLAERCQRFRLEFDEFRSAVVNEPRGSDVLVGVLICEPTDPNATAGVIFFNNVGTIGMCGHGTMGVAVAMAHAERITAGRHMLQTPVGDVPLELHADGQRVSLENVVSRRAAQAVTVDVPDYGTISGDVAWGGNWFFLVQDHGQELVPERIDQLAALTRAIRRALTRDGITGDDGAEIDHIELFSPTDNPETDSRNFVLCPGGAWDRSPCGTGTSAKLACLAADGKLQPGEVWRQESLIGSIFEASYQTADSGGIKPTITGRAWVTGESTLLLDPRDPFRMGIRR